MKTTYLIAGMLALGVGAGAAVAHQSGQGPRGMERISFEKLDANGDGKITQAEMEAQKKARFTAADTNGDGMLSADEMLAQGKARAGERMAKRMEQRIGQMIEKRDTNGDGMLSIDEIGGKRDGNMFFKRLDTDGDGAVSAEEFAVRKGGQRMQHGGNPASE